MRQRVENNVKEENNVWMCIADWLMLEFLPASGLGPDAPIGGVTNRSWSSCWKSLLKIFVGR